MGGRWKGRKDEGGKDDGRTMEGRGKDKERNKGRGAEFCGIILKEFFINSLWVVNWIWEEKRI